MAVRGGVIPSPEGANDRGDNREISRLCDRARVAHNGRMTRPGFQFSVTAMLGLVACVAVNLWLFRVGFVWGLVALNVTKHVGVAVLCRAIGVNRERPVEPGSIGESR